MLYVRIPLPHIGFGKVQDVTENTLTTDGLVRMLPNGLAGINLKPNRNMSMYIPLRKHGH